VTLLERLFDLVFVSAFAQVMTFLSHTATWVVCSAVMLQLGEATGVHQRLQRRRDAPGGSTTATGGRWRT
jgi:hypothetical protein